MPTVCAAAGLGDLVERTFQRGPRDALAAVFLVDKETGDPPVRRRRRVLLVLAPVLDARQFLGTAVLAPALRGPVGVDDERGVSAVRADPVLFPGPVPRRVAGIVGVIAHAPAAAEYPVVALDKIGEHGPGR